MVNTRKTSLEDSIKNSHQLRALINANGLTQEKTAELIRQSTGGSCTTRIVAGWLSSSKNNVDAATLKIRCPSWPIIALQKALVETSK
jgi:hypothetical protein